MEDVALTLGEVAQMISHGSFMLDTTPMKVKVYGVNGCSSFCQRNFLKYELEIGHNFYYKDRLYKILSIAEISPEQYAVNVS